MQKPKMRRGAKRLPRMKKGRSASKALRSTTSASGTRAKMKWSPRWRRFPRGQGRKRRSRRKRKKKRKKKKRHPEHPSSWSPNPHRERLRTAGLIQPRRPRAGEVQHGHQEIPEEDGAWCSQLHGKKSQEEEGEDAISQAQGAFTRRRSSVRLQPRLPGKFGISGGYHCLGHRWLRGSNQLPTQGIGTVIGVGYDTCGWEAVYQCIRTTSPGARHTQPYGDNGWERRPTSQRCGTVPGNGCGKAIAICVQAGLREKAGQWPSAPKDRSCKGEPRRYQSQWLEESSK